MTDRAIAIGDKFGVFELVAIDERPMGTLYVFHAPGQSFTIRWPSRRSALCAADMAFILPATDAQSTPSIV